MPKKLEKSIRKSSAPILGNENIPQKLKKIEKKVEKAEKDLSNQKPVVTEEKEISINENKSDFIEEI